MFRRDLKIKASWKVDEKVKRHLGCSISKQERSARKVERPNDVDSRVADAGGCDHAESKDRSPYKYVLPERCSYHVGDVMYEAKGNDRCALSWRQMTEREVLLWGE
jgi:hypothetical protein